MNALARRWYVDSVVSRCKRVARTVKCASKFMKLAAGEGSQGWGRSRYRFLFVTLTYRKTGEYDPRHLSDYLRRVRDYLDVRGARALYTWVGELQKRGALHYHLILAVPSGERVPWPDMPYRDGRKRLQPAMWPHGMANLQRERKDVTRYLAKYLSKLQPDNVSKFPKGARLCGWGGFDAGYRNLVRGQLLPHWYRRELLELEWRERAEAQAAEDHYFLGYAVHDGTRTAEEAAAWWAEEDRRCALQADRYPSGQAEWEAGWLEEFERSERWAEVFDHGRAAVRRVSGGLVDTVERTFMPTPFVVGCDDVIDADGRKRKVWWCEDRSDQRYAFPAGVTVPGDKPGEVWKLAAGYVPCS